jgi:hypothetical protein
MPWLSVREIRKDRKRSYLEKRLEEFYMPLIDLFSNTSLKRGMQELIEVERIIGVENYVLPEKPKWLLKAGYP